LNEREHSPPRRGGEYPLIWSHPEFPTKEDIRDQLRRSAYRQSPAEIEKAQLQFEICHEFRETRRLCLTGTFDRLADFFEHF